VFAGLETNSYEWKTNESHMAAWVKAAQPVSGGVQKVLNHCLDRAAYY
jgi:hypothetical protein